MQEIKIGGKEKVWWPIEVPVHYGDGSGKIGKVKLEVCYWRPDAERARELSDRPEMISDAEWTEVYLDRVAEHILDWKGPINAECTPDNVRLALNDLMLREPLVTGLEQVATGGRRKN